MRISDWSSDVCSSDLLAAIASSDKDFYGVPSPAAAAVITFFVWSCVDDSHSLFAWVSGHVPLTGDEVLGFAAPLTLATALSMVSSVRYNSFKKVNLKTRTRFLSLAAVIGVFALRSEEHTSELQSLMRISYAVFCLKKKQQNSAENS